MTVDDRLNELGIELPPAPRPAANYVAYKLHGDHLFIAGQLPFVGASLQVTGRLGAEVSLADGRDLARLAALNALAVARQSPRPLDGLEVLRLVVYVASAPDFYEQHLVADGASSVLIAVLGDCGQHTRTAVAVPVLPLNSPVEVELTFGVSIRTAGAS